MISIISPAKSMNFDPADTSVSFSELEEFGETKKILSELKSLSKAELKNLMKISDNLADLNFFRYQTFESLSAKQAILAYDGDVYDNIDKKTLSPRFLSFSQDHLRIVSGLYGLIRPLDKIRAYRLEMSIKLAKNAPYGLDKLWREKVTSRLNNDLKTHKKKCLINLASKEYVAAIDTKLLEFPMINIHFREFKDDVVKNIALNSKRARGMVVDYIVRNEIDCPEEIKKFNKSKYKYNSDLSDEGNYFFVKQ